MYFEPAMPQNQIEIFLRKRWVNLISQMVLGSIFIYASIGKIINPGDYAESISNYKILPNYLAGPIAIVLPYNELFFGLALILDYWTRLSATVLSILLIIFIVAIFSTILRGLNIDCGCFHNKGPELINTNPWLFILRDILFLIPGFIIIFFPCEKK